MYNTANLRANLHQLLQDVEAGAISNTAARVRVTVAKALIDTIKVEIAAAALGTEFSPLPLVDKIKR